MKRYSNGRKFHDGVKGSFMSALRDGDWETAHALSVSGGRHDGRRAMLRSLAERVMRETDGLPVPELLVPQNSVFLPGVQKVSVQGSNDSPFTPEV